MTLFRSLVFAAIIWPGVATLQAADSGTPGAKAFDFSDLDIPDKPGQLKKDDPPLPRSLPPEVATVILKLVKYEAVKEQALEDRIMESRKALAQKLSASAAKAQGPARAGFEEAARRCLTAPPLVRVAHPVATAAWPIVSTWSHKDGGSRRTFELSGLLTGDKRHGSWFWVDETKGIVVYEWGENDDCNLMRLTPAGADTLSNRGVAGKLVRAENPAAGAASEAFGILAATAMQEKLWFDARDAENAPKQARVHDWLMLQARSAKGDASTAILKEAAALETKDIPGTGKREHALLVAGVWLSKNGQHYQFFPDGLVAVNENLSAGIWKWGKSRQTMVVSLPATAPTTLFLARLASTEPGKLRLYTFDSPESVLTKEKETP